MVEFTYQDYLKYEKYLELQEQIRKENRYIHFGDEGLKRLADLLLRVEKLISDDDKEEELMLKEDDFPYIFDEDNQIEKENYQEVVEYVEGLNTKEKEKIQENRKKHDELFRNLLNDKEEFICFFKYFVNADTSLTKDDLRKYNRSFITSEYQSRTSDIVYKVKGKKIYYLIEHQSSIDYRMPYRILEYCYEIIRDTINKDKVNNKNYDYPKVIPIVLYTGNSKWKVPKVYKAISEGSYEDVGLEMKYILIDTNSYSKKKLLNSNSLVGYAMQADRSITNDDIAEAIEKMLITKPKYNKDIIDLINYVFKGVLTKEEIKNFDEKLKNGEVKEMLITVRERLAFNNQKILEQGIAQGIAQIVKKMKNSGMENDEIQKLTGLNKKEVESIIKNNS